jgi:2-polyprenyl-3-methyl-5-hydroxy-6-metoxy-1,4-benzoquinol methylase
VTASPCVICGGDTVPAFVVTDRNRRISDERFEYLRCQACDSLVLASVPDDIGRYYPATYYALPESRDALASATAPEHYKLDLLRSLVPGGRLVEVGPAVGGFVLHAKDAGYDTSAIEMDPGCCRFLRDVVGITVHETGDPAVALRANAPFDVIAMWQVLEHLADPEGALEAAAAALAPGGILAIAVPNPKALQLRVFGPRWTHVDAPRHRSLSPAETLIAVGRRLGLEVALLTMTDAGTLGWNWFGWRESLAGFSEDQRARTALRLAGSVLSRLMAPVERRGHNAATYTLVLRRPSEKSVSRAA